MSERWKPEHGETYYYVWTTGHTASTFWTNTISDKNLFERGNCFKTEEEAESASEKVKALMLSLHGDQLPKLTAEVFNHPDCPKWAKYAAVDADGSAVFFELTPSVSRFGNWWRRDGVRCLQFGTHYDSSDWKNSIIERPEKTTLPDWCKVGAIVYMNNLQIYKKIENEKELAYIKENNHIPLLRQARLRPYNADEMKALVGKVLDTPAGAYCIYAYDIHTDNVETAYAFYNAQDFLDCKYSINNAPCGVLEHLNDNGEWEE